MSLQDILNHVIEDLDEFIRLLKSKAAAWNELEKKKKKSKRKKHDGKLKFTFFVHIAHPVHQIPHILAHAHTHTHVQVILCV